ncbi:unnamed protein product [Paramecium octaurelia]|uniref:Uncharacterized protein n=1 Tax=Paramecium octaurelia TaxID=43137 RepID=A0A8S1YBW5_PAROT|nr:unnamed protein product [Paramecium octaurelia]
MCRRIIPKIKQRINKLSHRQQIIDLNKQSIWLNDLKEQGILLNSNIIMKYQIIIQRWNQLKLLLIPNFKKIQK